MGVLAISVIRASALLLRSLRSTFGGGVGRWIQTGRKKSGGSRSFLQLQSSYRSDVLINIQTMMMIIVVVVVVVEVIVIMALYMRLLYT
jgi:hypothetical protein